MGRQVRLTLVRRERYKLRTIEINKYTNSQTATITLSIVQNHHIPPFIFRQKCRPKCYSRSACHISNKVCNLHAQQLQYHLHYTTESNHSRQQNKLCLTCISQVGKPYNYQIKMDIVLKHAMISTTHPLHRLNSHTLCSSHTTEHCRVTISHFEDVSNYCELVRVAEPKPVQILSLKERERRDKLTGTTAQQRK